MGRYFGPWVLFSALSGKTDLLGANFKTPQFGQVQGGSEISTAGILGYSED
jgi:hypothetical protein